SGENSTTCPEPLNRAITWPGFGGNFSPPTNASSRTLRNSFKSYGSKSTANSCHDSHALPAFPHRASIQLTADATSFGKIISGSFRTPGGRKAGHVHAVAVARPSVADETHPTNQTGPPAATRPTGQPPRGFATQPDQTPPGPAPSPAAGAGTPGRTPPRPQGSGSYGPA